MAVDSLRDAFRHALRRLLRRPGPTTAIVLILALGRALSLALARSLSALLYGVDERDPLTYLGGAAVIALVAAIACLLPARRAVRVDPTLALRSE